MSGSLMSPHRCPRTGRRVRQPPRTLVSSASGPSCTCGNRRWSRGSRNPAHRNLLLSGISADLPTIDQPTSHDDRSRGCISRMIGHRPRLEHASLGEPAGSPPEQLRIESALRRTCIGFVVSPGRILDELRSATSELDRLGAVTSSFGCHHEHQPSQKDDRIPKRQQPRPQVNGAVDISK